MDNGSDAGFAAPLASEFPEVEVLSLPDNLGYAGGCNAGIVWARRTGAEYVLLLNDDATIAADALTALATRAAVEESPVLVAPKIMNSRRDDTIWSAGGYIRRPWLKADHFGEGQPADSHNEPREVEWASGCALFFPLALVDAIGPMDDRYFLYLEDVEWCLRAHARGFRVLYEPTAVVRHEVSAATGQLDTRIKRYYSYRNYYLLAFQHSGVFGRAWFACHFGITFGKVGLRWLTSSYYRNDPWYHARTRAMFDVLRRRWGKAPYGDDMRRADATPVTYEVTA